MPKSLAVLDAPMHSAPTSAGTLAFGRAIRDTGLIQRLGAADAGAVPTPGDATALGRAIAQLLDADRLPIVLGGDCSVITGVAAALRGRHGLAYIDGHSDFNHAGNLEPQPATARNELAVITGRGGAGTCFRDEDVAAIGFRRADPAFQELRKTEILLWPIFWLYEHSRAELDKSLLRRLDRDELAGIWIHLDVDALDPTLVSAVPHPLADGLSGPELVAILRLLIDSGKVAGMSIANLIPAGDPTGRQLALIADVLTEAFIERADGGTA